MSVIIETSLGDITVDLYTQERPRCCLNFLKLCKIKYYNFNLFHSVQQNLVAQTGDPDGTGRGGASIYAHLYGDQAKFFEAEVKPRIKHTKRGMISMVNNGQDLHGSQFFITLADELDYLDGVHTVFGEVAEGFDVLDKINETHCDQENRPFKDIRIYHTVILDDPYDDPAGIVIPDRSPEPTKDQLDSGRIGAEEEVDDTKGKTKEEVFEMTKDREAKTNARLLELVGDIPEEDVAPPDNVLFVCKLNPVTTSDDLEIIFSRFGNIASCEVIKDQKTQESLQYAFIEFEKPEDCESAYFKMDNVLIDDRRIHVDFSQSVSKYKWKGKGGQPVDSEKNAPEKPRFVIKDKSKQGHGYELVASDDEESPKKKKSKKHKRSKSRSRSRSPQHKKHKQKSHHSKRRSSRSRSRSRSPTQHRRSDKKYRNRERSASEEREDRRRHNDRNRDRDRKYSRR
ncbi:peptidyl-prolyl cis-trans isomerase-like 4 [Tubulanus polymorphus]|uniref:peptidyl-prolyl cis-trans isomerase-like 4 n=1 Tax=Tubulanus polymorphus TaxID=672921 RepID=UPI003DA52609